VSCFNSVYEPKRSGRPGLASHVVGELAAVGQPHGEDGVQPGVVDGGSPVRQGPPGHEGPEGGQPILVLGIGVGDPGLPLALEGPVRPEGGGDVEHRGGEALPHLGVDQLVEQEGVEHKAGAHGPHRGPLGVDEHRSGGAQLVGDRAEDGIVGQHGRVGGHFGGRCSHCGHHLYRGVVVGRAHQERGRLVDSLPPIEEGRVAGDQAIEEVGALHGVRGVQGERRRPELGHRPEVAGEIRTAGVVAAWGEQAVVDLDSQRR
jgi:hypothetical protein